MKRGEKVKTLLNDAHLSSGRDDARACWDSIPGYLEALQAGRTKKTNKARVGERVEVWKVPYREVSKIDGSIGYLLLPSRVTQLQLTNQRNGKEVVCQEFVCSLDNP